jgi:hypothetical protein
MTRQPVASGCTPDQLRRAHAAFYQGARDPLNVARERAYQAWRKRVRRGTASETKVGAL